MPCVIPGKLCSRVPYLHTEEELQNCGTRFHAEILQAECVCMLICSGIEGQNCEKFVRLKEKWNEENASASRLKAKQQYEKSLYLRQAAAPLLR